MSSSSKGHHHPLRRARSPAASASFLLLLASCIVVLQHSSSPAMAQGVGRRIAGPKQSAGGKGRAPRSAGSSGRSGRTGLRSTPRPEEGSRGAATGRAPSAPRYSDDEPESMRRIAFRNDTYDNMTDGNMTDGNVTDGNMTDGNMTDGNVTDGNVTDGNVTYPSDDMMNNNTMNDTMGDMPSVGEVLMVTGDITVTSADGSVMTMSGENMTLFVTQHTMDTGEEVVDPLYPDPYTDDGGGEYYSPAPAPAPDADESESNSTENSTTVPVVEEDPTVVMRPVGNGTTVDEDTPVTTVTPAEDVPVTPAGEVGAVPAAADSTNNGSPVMNINMEFVMCGSSRIAIDDDDLKRIDEVQESTGADITVTTESASGKCSCRVFGTAEQVEEAVKKVQAIIA